MLGLNTRLAAPMAFCPCSGGKSSFYADRHASGQHGLSFFTENKVEITRWFSGPGGEQAPVERPVETGP